ncbi:unnamed protein product [Amoebophrya sp. A120]|nr:unnamed protein product [Amoebophrya sp. A120]|eukprot:GSA120T00005284001.1
MEYPSPHTNFFPLTLPSPTLTFDHGGRQQSQQQLVASNSETAEALRVAEEKIQEMDRQFAQQVQLEMERYRVEQVEPQIERLHYVIRGLEEVARQRDGELTEAREMVQELEMRNSVCMNELQQARTPGSATFDEGLLQERGFSENLVPARRSSSFSVNYGGGGGGGRSNSSRNYNHNDQTRSRSGSSGTRRSRTWSNSRPNRSDCFNGQDTIFVDDIALDELQQHQHLTEHLHPKKRLHAATAWRSRLMKRCCFYHWKTFGRKARTSFRLLAHAAVRYSWQVFRARGIMVDNYNGKNTFYDYQPDSSGLYNNYDPRTQSFPNYPAKTPNSCTTATSADNYTLYENVPQYPLDVEDAGGSVGGYNHERFSRFAISQHSNFTTVPRADIALLHALCLCFYNKYIRSKALQAWKAGVLQGREKKRHNAFQLDLAAQTEHARAQNRRVRSHNRKTAMTFANVRDFLQLKNVFCAWTRITYEMKDVVARQHEFLDDMRERLEEQALLRNAVKGWFAVPSKRKQRSQRATVCGKLLENVSKRFVLTAWGKQAEKEKAARAGSAIRRRAVSFLAKKANTQLLRTALGQWQDEVNEQASQRLNRLNHEMKAESAKAAYIDLLRKKLQAEKKAALRTWSSLSMSLNARRAFVLPRAERHCAATAFAVWRATAAPPLRSRKLGFTRTVFDSWRQYCLRTSVASNSIEIGSKVQKRAFLHDLFASWQKSAAEGLSSSRICNATAAPFSACRTHPRLLPQAIFANWVTAAQKTRADRIQARLDLLRAKYITDRARQKTLQIAFALWRTAKCETTKERKQYTDEKQQTNFDRMLQRDRHLRQQYLRVCTTREIEELQRFFFQFWAAITRQEARFNARDAEDRRLVSTFSLAKLQAQRPFLRLLHDDIFHLNTQLVFYGWKTQVAGARKVLDFDPPKNSVVQQAVCGDQQQDKENKVAAIDNKDLLRQSNESPSKKALSSLANRSPETKFLNRPLQELETSSGISSPARGAARISSKLLKFGPKSPNISAIGFPPAMQNHHQINVDWSASIVHPEVEMTQLMQLQKKQTSLFVTTCESVYQKVADRDLLLLLFKTWVAYAEKKKRTKAHTGQLRELRETTLNLVADILQRDSAKKRQKTAFEAFRLIRNNRGSLVVRERPDGGPRPLVQQQKEQNNPQAATSAMEGSSQLVAAPKASKPAESPEQQAVELFPAEIEQPQVPSPIEELEYNTTPIEADNQRYDPRVEPSFSVRIDNLKSTASPASYTTANRATTKRRHSTAGIRTKTNYTQQPQQPRRSTILAPTPTAYLEEPARSSSMIDAATKDTYIRVLNSSRTTRSRLSTRAQQDQNFSLQALNVGFQPFT